MYLEMMDTTQLDSLDQINRFNPSENIFDVVFLITCCSFEINQAVVYN